MMGYTMVGTTDLDRAVVLCDAISEGNGLHSVFKDDQVSFWEDKISVEAQDRLRLLRRKESLFLTIHILRRIESRQSGLILRRPSKRRRNKTRVS